ncbi:MAG: hypothetical protein KJ941_13500 [Bacteroidetes bacterium]|nr:hypothetical protein [Bacteroidota bacterium]
MKISEFKTHLAKVDSLVFQLPNGEFVPSHFHITEVGMMTKNFIDCGGTVREDKKISLQLWTAEDTDHRLTVEKTLRIIAMSEKIIGLEDLEIEVEFQQQTIAKFGIEYSNSAFKLTSTQTACLAEEACGIPTEKTKRSLSELSSNEQSSCVPGGGCC